MVRMLGGGHDTRNGLLQRHSGLEKENFFIKRQTVLFMEEADGTEE